MICCLCGEVLEHGDALIQISQHKLTINSVNGREVLVQIPLEDGTMKKLAHSVCPAKFGAPLELIGAGGSWHDV